ncbi:2-phospho-L-lactate guanylyltransferase, partial [Nocardiopsis dassonvillei]|nr:2-phospho-L-lactate guanylyltransferase [Nocardiopsis dassonvillei]
MTGCGEQGGAPRPGARWSLVVPVKRLGRAKTRLAPVAGGRREDLALAIACDTVAAARACPG